MRIIITGGHHNSALVTAGALRERGYDITWVGHRYTMIADSHDSLEYQEVTAKNFPFINLIAGKFHPKAHPIHLFRLPIGFFQAMYILMRIRPQLILTFGGYIAVPVALSAKIFGIPVIVFEQTTAIGRANELLSKFSTQNFLTWNSSLEYFPRYKSQVIGLPLPAEIWQPASKKWFHRKKPTVLITGGKQGSQTINHTVFALVPGLVNDFNIIHQTGASRKTRDSLIAEKLQRSLPENVQPFYHHQEHFSQIEMLEALKSSDIVISRAGAHITYELLALQRSAILVPLPFSYLQEQMKNALKLQEYDLATIITQDKLNPVVLKTAIKTLMQKRLTKREAAFIPTDATETVIDYIVKRYPNAQAAAKKS